MSVISLLKLPDVREQLRRIVPQAPFRIAAPLVAPPLTRSYALVGTAFDYAARFELERRCHHVRSQPWVAEAALSRLPRYASAPAILKAAKRLVSEARTDIGVYAETTTPTEEQRAAMVAHSIRLAKLDTTFRAGYVDPQMTVAEPDNVRDVLRLMDVAPFETLAHPTTLWLNPTFGEYSRLVGGADCDLVSGDRLIDLKVTKNNALDEDYLLQLVSYAMLGRGARVQDSEWPEVRQIGIYFARHGHLWMTSTKAIYAHPDYNEVETWYFRRAAQIFGTQIPSTIPKARGGWPITPGMTSEEIAFIKDDFEEKPPMQPKQPKTEAAPTRKPAKVVRKARKPERKPKATRKNR